MTDSDRSFPLQDSPPEDRLAHFLTAQDSGGTYAQALAELKRGRKCSHWMWFIFPQLAGLGRSATSVRYAITDLEHARDYLRDPVLGPRLRAAAAVVADSPEPDAQAMFGGVDALKLQSSMTLFAAADPRIRVFSHVLDRYYDGRRCERTAYVLADA
ncbi:MAG: DUF1810 domain-containing protein, partial [Micrococcales bacterium]|nr:DUF1810 domain-containing protein [Micrococcales bacterium]